MRYFDVRSTIPIAQSAWPQRLPDFVPLAAPAIVSVPLSVRTSSHHALSLPVGSEIAAGRPVIDSLLESAHAPLTPVSGRIGTTRAVSLLNGQQVRVVDIEASAPTEIAPPPEDSHKSEAFTSAFGAANELNKSALPHWIDRLRNAGVHADRQTCPDILGQLYQALSRPIDTVICNALDADPAQRLRASILAKYPAAVTAAITLLAKITGANNRWLVVDDESPAGFVSPVRRSARNASLRFMPVTNDYPRGNPTLLLHALLGRPLRPRRMPTELGVLLVDPICALAIGLNLMHGALHVTTPLSIHDYLRGRVHYAWAAVGTPLTDVLEGLEIALEDVSLRAGAMLRDLQVSADAIVAGSELTLHALPRLAPVAADPCIRCAWCIEGCPTRIHPAGLLEAAQKNSLPLAEHYGLDSCIECGICSYVCPSHLPILAGIRRLKSQKET